MAISGLKIGLSGGKIAYFHQNLYEITIYDIPCCLDLLLALVTLWKCKIGVFEVALTNFRDLFGYSQLKDMSFRG